MSFDSPCSPVKTPIKKHKKTRFQGYWLSYPILKLCTEKVSEDDIHAKFIYCQKVVLAENYVDSVASSYHTCRIPELHKTILNKICEEEQNLDKTVLKAFMDGEFNKRQLELMLLNFIIQNNISFELGERLSTFIASLEEQE